MKIHTAAGGLAFNVSSLTGSICYGVPLHVATGYSPLH